MVCEALEVEHTTDWLAVATYRHKPALHRAPAWLNTVPVMTEPKVTPNEWADTQPLPAPTTPDPDAWQPAGAWFEGRVALLLLIAASILGSAFHYLPF